MNKKELIDALAKRQKLKLGEARTLLESSMKAIEARLIAGDSVVFRNFGTLSSALRKERKFFNPKEGVLMEAPRKIVVVFKSAKALADRLRQRG